MPLNFFGILDRRFGIHSKAWLSFGECVAEATTDGTTEPVAIVMVVVECVVDDGGGGNDGLITIFSSCVGFFGDNGNDGDNEANGSGTGWPWAAAIGREWEGKGGQGRVLS